MRKTARFFTAFGYFIRLWRIIWLLWIFLPPPPGRALPPPIVELQAVLGPPTRSLAPSKCRPGASRLLPRHDVSPPSLLLVAWKSYMTSSRTTTSIYIAAWFRVNLFDGFVLMNSLNWVILYSARQPVAKKYCENLEASQQAVPIKRRKSSVHNDQSSWSAGTTHFCLWLSPGRF